MARDTQSSHKVKDEELNSLKHRKTSGVVISSGPSSTRRSERLEKQTLTNPLLKTKSERVEKQLIPSLSRRFERGNEFDSTNSPHSNNPSILSEMKHKKEKSGKKVEQLSLEARVVSRNGKQGLTSVHMTIARAYRSLFRPKKVDIADISKQLKGPDRTFNRQRDVVESGFNGCNRRSNDDEREKRCRKSCERSPEQSNSSSRKFSKETEGSQGEVESSSPTQIHRRTVESVESRDGDNLQAPEGGNSLFSPHRLVAKENSDDAERVQMDCSIRENLQAPILIESTSIEGSLNDEAVEGKGQQSISSKRKRNDAVMNSDACVAVGSENIADGVSSLPSDIKGNNIMQRLHNDSSKQDLCCGPAELDQQLCPSSSFMGKKGPLIKLSKFPGVDLPGNGTNCLYAINKLRGYWHKCHNCVVFDDQDRIVNVVSFILSLQSNVCRPFVIISTIAALLSWETEFLKLAPSVSTMLYNGSKEKREVIRRVEFYGDGGCVNFKVLLSSPEAIIEDLEEIKFIGWEAVIVDEWPRSRMSTHFEKLKMLVTEMRLLLISGPMKDSVAEYLSLLSFLGPRGDVKISDGAETDPCDDIGNVKERLSRFIAYACKIESSKFVEYWVPVQLSNFQLEQYCSTLLLNSIALRSTSKNDQVGAMHGILTSIRKCCNHPYSVDPSLQPLLTNGLKDVEVLNFGIKASGKLQLLDAILPEIKKQGLRTLILFQSIGGSERDTIGDILDDFIRLRFGPDSYEHVDGGGVMPSKKQAALNKFNNKECGRFVFLLENRACLPSIKLSSVDIIMIFNSDLNPANDLRALQRITIESHSEQIKVLRLYLPCTVEEKVLILPKQDIALDSNLPSISRSTSHMLLMWGASFLFKKLDEFHGSNSPSFGVNLSSQLSFFNDSVQELLTLITQKSSSTTNSSILKVQHSGRTCCKDISLPGEQEIQSADEKQHHVFWAQLLEGRHPQWKYSSWPSLRNRKRVQVFEELPKQTDSGSQSVEKKRKKVDKGQLLSPNTERASGIMVNGAQSLPESTSCVDRAVNTNHAATSSLMGDHNSEVAQIHVVDSEEKGSLGDAQRSLHLLLKPQLSKLCEVLQFSEDVKGMVAWFLEFIMNNYLLCREPVSILQALQLSLCWAAASKLRHNIDRKKSLTLAKQHLNFSCQEEEVNSIYSKFHFLKKLSHVENVKESDIRNGSKSTVKEVSDNLHAGVSQQEQGGMDFEVLKEAMARKKKRFQNKHYKQLKKLLGVQQKEVREFEEACDGKKVELENWYRVEAGHIDSICSDFSVRADKLRILDMEFAEKMKEHKSKNAVGHIDLEAKQLAAIDMLNQEKARCMQELKSWALLHESGHGVEGLSSSENISALDCSRSVVSMSGHLSEEESPNHIVGSMRRIDVVPSETDASVPNEATGSSFHVRTNMVEMLNDDESGQLSDSPLGHASDIGIWKQSSSGNCNSPNRVWLINLLREKRIPDGATPNKAVPPEISENAAEVAEGDQHIERLTLVTDSSRENDAASCRPIIVNSNQHDGGSSINGECLNSNPHQVNHSERGVLSDCGLSPPTLALLNECSSQSTSNEVPRGVIRCDHSNDAAGIIDAVPQLVSPMEIQDDVTARTQQNVPSNHSNHDATIEDPVLQSQLSVSAYLPWGQSQPDLTLEDGVEHQLSNNGQSYFQITQVPVSVSESPDENLNVAVSNSLACSSPHFDNSACGFETHLLDTRIPSSVTEHSRILPHASSDPLQNELESICAAVKNASKIHDDTKLRLRSDCEKEIEEAVTHIHSKYKIKLQEIDAAFLLKKEELHTNENKVIMNKILAEAFRSKCMDIQTSVAQRMLQAAATSSFMQQLIQLQTQQSSPTTSFTMGGPSSAGIPVQLVHNPVALSTDPTPRPPQIRSITPSTRNHQVACEIRAPAPHLHVSSLPPLPRGVASHLISTNPISSSLPQAPPRPPLPLMPPESTVEFSGVRSPSLSSRVDSVMEIDNVPGLLPPLPDLGLNFDSWDLAELVGPI